MSRYKFDDDEPYVVIEQHIGGHHAVPDRRCDRRRRGVAPRAALGGGHATRHQASRDARPSRGGAGGVGRHRPTSPTRSRTRAAAWRSRSTRRARRSISRRQQVNRAMDAGRAAAREAREELEHRIAETKAAYNARAPRWRSGRAAVGR